MKKYAKGTAKIIPSTLSNKPPWPGNNFPVFLIFDILLKYETVKSPIWLIDEINITVINNTLSVQ